MALLKNLDHPLAQTAAVPLSRVDPWPAHIRFDHMNAEPGDRHGVKPPRPRLEDPRVLSEGPSALGVLRSRSRTGIGNT